MNDEELDALIASAALTEEQVASLPIGGLSTQLRERTIMTTHWPSVGDPTIPAAAPLRRPRLALRAAAAAVLLAAGGAVFASTSHDPTTSAYGAESVAFAKSTPRLLVRAEGCARHIGGGGRSRAPVRCASACTAPRSRPLVERTPWSSRGDQPTRPRTAPSTPGTSSPWARSTLPAIQPGCSGLEELRRSPRSGARTT